MSTAPRYVPHYTVEDYGHWEGDWELIDGVPISMSPSPFGPHERIVSRLALQLGTQIKDHGRLCEVYTNLDWIVSDEVSYDGELTYQAGQARVAAMLIPNSVT